MRALPFGRARIYLLLICVPFFLSLQIVFQTRTNSHPDEADHARAFCYFESAWWPPDLNSDVLGYSVYGWNRVYEGELVYIVYGRISAFIRSGLEWILRATEKLTSIDLASLRYRILLAPGLNSPKCSYLIQTYRLLNSVLYLITVVILFRVARQHGWSLAIALVMLSIPQVVYIYSYANDDASGVSLSIFLFLFALTRPSGFLFSRRDALILGLLTGLVLLSKQVYWFVLPLVALALGWKVWEDPATRRSLREGRVWMNAVLLFATVLVVVAPLKIIYPWTQGDYGAKRVETLETRAAAGFKPSSPIRPGFRLASKGVAWEEVVGNSQWQEWSAKSFYGVFGYMNVYLPLRVYLLALVLFTLGVFLTLFFAFKRWRDLPLSFRVLGIASPILILMVIGSSVYYSWMYDYQPQGRYLFSGVIPLAILLGGTVEFEPRWLRSVRFGMFAISYGICLWSLWAMVLQNRSYFGS